MRQNLSPACIIVLAIFGMCLRCDCQLARNVMKCYSKSPLNLSDDICGDLCHKEAVCSKESGACVCDREPTPTTLGGHFTHCTNWNYVEQSECRGLCQSEGKNDSRVCWTFSVGNYCTCFDKLLVIEFHN